MSNMELDAALLKAHAMGEVSHQSWVFVAFSAFSAFSALFFVVSAFAPAAPAGFSFGMAFGAIFAAGLGAAGGFGAAGAGVEGHTGGPGGFGAAGAGVAAGGPGGFGVEGSGVAAGGPGGFGAAGAGVAGGPGGFGAEGSVCQVVVLEVLCAAGGSGGCQVLAGSWCGRSGGPEVLVQKDLVCSRWCRSWRFWLLQDLVCQVVLEVLVWQVWVLQALVAGQQLLGHLCFCFCLSTLPLPLPFKAASSLPLLLHLPPSLPPEPGGGP